MPSIPLAFSHGKISLESLLPDLMPGARERHGPCPFCGGTRRFVVFLDSQRGFCHSCDWRGDAIQLLRDRDGLSFAEAKRKLGLATGYAPAAKRQATIHSFALAVAKRSYHDWRQKTLNDLIDPYQELCTKCYITEVACRAIDRAPHIYPNDEQDFWFHRRAVMRERLGVVNHALYVLIFNAQEPERFAWWQRTKGAIRG